MRGKLKGMILELTKREQRLALCFLLSRLWWESKKREFDCGLSSILLLRTPCPPLRRK